MSAPLLDAILGPDESPKLEVGVSDPAAFAAWAAERGATAEQAWAHIIRCLTPADQRRDDELDADTEWDDDGPDWGEQDDADWDGDA